MMFTERQSRAVVEGLAGIRRCSVCDDERTSFEFVANGRPVCGKCAVKFYKHHGYNIAGQRRSLTLIAVVANTNDASWPEAFWNKAFVHRLFDQHGAALDPYRDVDVHVSDST
jgi:hypothetical protein